MSGGEHGPSTDAVDSAPPRPVTLADGQAPAPFPVDPHTGEVIVQGRTPAAGELTPAWRLVTAITWIAVAVAIGSVWKTSDQLGLSTWWLGPRGEPQPRAIQLLPFVPALGMVLATINNVRRLPWLGLVAASIVAAIGVADIGRFARLAVVEIGIGAAAAVVSLASLTGMLRPAASEPAGGRPARRGSR